MQTALAVYISGGTGNVITPATLELGKTMNSRVRAILPVPYTPQISKILRNQLKQNKYSIQFPILRYKFMT